MLEDPPPQPCAVEGCVEPGTILLLSPSRAVRIRVCTNHSDAMDSHGFHMADVECPTENIYLVGEKGPEWFFPTEDPRIISGDQ